MGVHPKALRRAWTRLEIARLGNPLDQLIVTCELIGGGTMLCIGAGLVAFAAGWGWMMVAAGVAVGVLGASVLLRSR